MGKSFSRLLGGGNGAKVKNRPQVSDHDKAVLDLKVARDRLKRYQKKLDGEAQMLTTQAQALVKEGRKDRALVLLKIKRFKAEQASKADAQLFTVTELLETVEWEGHQAQVLAALSEGTKALNSLHEAMPIEDVEQLMADTQEALEYEQQVNSIIAGAWSPENEDELLEEFEALQKEMAAEAAPAAAAAAAAPAAVAADAAAEAAVAAAAASAAAAALRPKPAAQQQPAAAVEETEMQVEEAPTAAAAAPAAAAATAAAAPAAEADASAASAKAEAASEMDIEEPAAASASQSAASQSSAEEMEGTSEEQEPAADIASLLPEVPTGEVALRTEDAPAEPAQCAPERVAMVAS